MERQLWLRLVYARSDETSRDLTYSFIACHGNCMHRPTCHFQMRCCMENCAISRREIVKKYFIYSRNYSIPHRNEEKNEFYNTDFLVSVLKISMIPSSTTRRSSFTYISWSMWSPLRDRMMHNVQLPSLKTSGEEFVQKITDFRDY